MLPSVVEITVRSADGEGIGSGGILTSTGRILTNNHVVTAAASDNGGITVTSDNRKKATATIVGSNASADVAVIQAENVSGLMRWQLRRKRRARLCDPSNQVTTILDTIVSNAIT